VRIRAVLNPRAGLAAQRALEVLRAGRPSWPEIEVRQTEGPGHARELGREAAGAGFDLVLAVGGDGTANETAAGLLGSPTALGLVPMGSGNGLARALRIPLRQPAQALAVLEEAVHRRMDVGSVNGQPFLNVAGAGFDAAIGVAFQARGRRGARRGIFPYVHLGLKMAFTYRSDTWQLQAGDQRFEGRALIVAFVNGREYGASAVIAPRARLDDGLLDVVVFAETGVGGMLLNTPRLFLGTIERFRGYRHFTARQAVLRGTGPALFHRDGEPEPAAERLEVRVEPRALSVLVPRATAEDPQGPFGPQ
jgi:diacylglycerol kinase (ATP)